MKDQFRMNKETHESVKNNKKKKSISIIFRGKSPTQWRGGNLDWEKLRETYKNSKFTERQTRFSRVMRRNDARYTKYNIK